MSFLDRSLSFTTYPFAPASVPGAVDASAIRDVDGLAAPPEVRLHTGETLFVDAPRADELKSFAERNGVPHVHRPDVWGDLLEPFLDTEFTTADDERTKGRLLACGFTVEEVTAIRARFGPAMISYNFDSMLWDWVHLGLYDLLGALTGRLAAPQHTLPSDELTRVYWWAMEVADRSKDLCEPR